MEPHMGQNREPAGPGPCPCGQMSGGAALSMEPPLLRPRYPLAVRWRRMTGMRVKPSGEELVWMIMP